MHVCEWLHKFGCCESHVVIVFFQETTDKIKEGYASVKQYGNGESFMLWIKNIYIWMNLHVFILIIWLFILPRTKNVYRQTSNIRGTLDGYKIVDHSDVVGASPIGAAPTVSSFST